MSHSDDGEPKFGSEIAPAVKLTFLIALGGGTQAVWFE
jgi:hypothetical protein